MIFFSWWAEAVLFCLFFFCSLYISLSAKYFVFIAGNSFCFLTCLKALPPTPTISSVSMDRFLFYGSILDWLSSNVSLSSIVHRSIYCYILWCSQEMMIIMIYKILVVKYCFCLYWLWIATYRNKSIYLKRYNLVFTLLLPQGGEWGAWLSSRHFLSLLVFLLPMEAEAGSSYWANDFLPSHASPQKTVLLRAGRSGGSQDGVNNAFHLSYLPHTHMQIVCTYLHVHDHSGVDHWQLLFSLVTYSWSQTWHRARVS